MAHLIVGGITVPVAIGRSESRPSEVGEVVESFNGYARSSVRARRGRWQVETVPMTEVATDALMTVLSQAVIACSGRLTGGAVNCAATGVRKSPVKGGATYWTVAFTLMESA